tara:strand:+ start:2532 stop:3872 length:1341 start_codon:yes stop_codon:yes gene_type:complete
MVKRMNNQDLKTKKTYSCTALHSSVYFAPNELRHCCKRFFVNGKMKGDVQIFPVKKNEDISVDKILKEKKRLYDSINKGEETPCSGCPFLTLDYWPKLKKLELKHLSIESHSVCNMKCTYCSDIYYGGLKANYNIEKIFNKFKKSGVVSKHLDVAWGGGEPTLMENFDNIFKNFTENFKPKSNKIYSNAIKYSKTIEKYLKIGKASMTTSIDAGTEKIFKKVRGVKAFEKVLKNLKKYLTAAGKGIVIKYIFTEDNYQMHEINNFINKIKEHGLQKCDFQISSNFKDEKLDNEQTISAIKLYTALIQLGANTCYFDDHLHPRLKNKIKEIFESGISDKDPIFSVVNNFQKNKDLNIVIWGSGDTARQMIKRSLFFENNNVRIHYFVDSDKSKHGKYIDDIEIRNPNEIKKSDHSIIIASTIFYRDIYDKLIQMGIGKERIMGSLFF